MIGWGDTENSKGYPILQKAYVPPVNISDCEEKFAKLKKLSLSENQICAGGVGKDMKRIFLSFPEWNT